MSEKLEAGQGPDVSAPADKRGIRSWMMFDWAAQPFFTVVTTFIFGPYFISRMAENQAVGQAAWGYGLAAAGISVAILSPILGSIADQTGPRKPWIAGFALIKVIMLFLLWHSAPGSPLWLTVLVFSIASIAAEFSIVFNDSMMPRLVPAKDVGRVSNTAWGLGYAGGMIVLIAVIALMAGSPDTGKTLLGLDPLFGLDPVQGEDARVTGPLSAVWYLIFILPMFLFTPDTPRQTGKAVTRAVSEGLKELKGTFAEARQKAGLIRFLIARMIYQDGVNALLAFGGGFAAGMFGWSIMEIGIFGIILNVVAIFGCLVAGHLDTRFGSKAIVIASILCLLVATVGIMSTGTDFTLFGAITFEITSAEGLFATPAEKAYLMFGLLIGLAFGPVQASSRSYMARSIHPDDAGRYFGLYAMTGRAISFIAPFLIATITSIALSSGLPQTEAARLGMSVIIVFLVVGLAILWTTPYPAADPNEKVET